MAHASQENRLEIGGKKIDVCWKSFAQFLLVSALDASFLTIERAGFQPQDNLHIAGTAEVIYRSFMRDGYPHHCGWLIQADSNSTKPFTSSF